MNPSPSTPAALLFDLDGTLVDTAADFQHAAIHVAEAFHYPIPEAGLTRAAVSDGSAGILAAAFGVTPEHPEFMAMRQLLLESYLGHIHDDSRLFAPLDELLIGLEKKATPWGIVTNKPRRYAEALLAGLGLSPRCATLVCADDVVNTKPHPEALLRAARECACDATDCWYVGDHERDIQAGKAAGMYTLAAAWGYLKEEENPAAWQADRLLTTPASLLALYRQTLLNPDSGVPAHVQI